MTALGPEGFENIAIIGSAPSSVRLAPYEDNKWAIWACSPGVFGVAPRSDVWFELHRFHPAEPGKNLAPSAKPWFSSEFTAFLQQHRLVMMNAEYPMIPNCQRFPFEEMIAKYGRYHFTSTIAWMLAMAIECKPKKIGLFGVDMAATEEYSYQRPGCQHFIGLALSIGIQVVLPPESDLMQPPAMYGLSELNPRHIKIRARLDEFNSRLAALSAQQEATLKEILFLQGAKDDANYVLQSWSDDVPFEPHQAVSMAFGASSEVRNGLKEIIAPEDKKQAIDNINEYNQLAKEVNAEIAEKKRGKKSNGASHPV